MRVEALVASLRRDHRPVACGPGTQHDVTRRDVIGVPSEPARSAEKLRLAPPVALVYRAALRTGPGRVAGVDHHDRHARERRLVLDEGPELPEGPVRLSRPLSTPHTT